MLKKAKITEIFSSIQGEGAYLGQLQTFIRFYGCNLRCGFCDEAEKNKFKEYSAQEFINAVIKENGAHPGSSPGFLGRNTEPAIGFCGGRTYNKVVCLTGGEPLLYAGFLKEALPALRKKGFIVYLETNGTLKNKLLEIIDFLDIISMDIKLPSSTGDRAFWKAHYDFLKASGAKEVFVKSVITNKTTLSDIKKAVSIIEKVDKAVFFILQPVTCNNRIQKIEQAQEFLGMSSSRLDNVRLIPQVHKILGVK
ncbi:MAG: 7-carboxy-7-deazaguanine synthase QueE [Candidatus Omnitrophica bacterium]|nr:7-carboxy-7-deazaguanine synthase QueE [Candidatus Omnitrophota bacterium]